MAFILTSYISSYQVQCGKYREYDAIFIEFFQPLEILKFFEKKMWVFGSCLPMITWGFSSLPDRVHENFLDKFFQSEFS